ncbi:MAG TPA: type I polyketide synthase [Verrucomicrobiota bacterium]|nr:hypothetical protein [Verrucomicrobiales bacterium]HRI15380.1 type I polyketide synthase [Verrucomicrobiota bacterium]
MEPANELESVAIIGLAGKFPGADSVAQFWSNLCAGRESITRFSHEDLRAHGVPEPDLADPQYVAARGVLADADQFDADFFGWTPREAEMADPQQRLFLSCVWEAFEDAGYDPLEGSRSVGVFAGASLNTYFLSTVLQHRASIEAFVRGFQAEGYAALVGNDKDYLATRVAHQFDFRGPALTIQTACSTSLVAIAQACQSLLTFQCDFAVAGGVSVTFPQTRGYIYQEGAIASRDGHCRAFDADASGTVFGSGCGVVLLRRLSDALEARDPIYAIIRSVALNNDGSEKASYLAPSIEGQAEAIALAHALAGVSADTISYVEAHGTGTPIGDPIELAGLTKAFRSTTSKTGFCGLGSLKTNIGHLESAAGVAGVIKTALALRHGVLPATLHFSTANPDLDLPTSPFFVIDRLRPWDRGPEPRRAGVSSFGVGGTNAHAVLEEAPDIPRRIGDGRHEVLLLLSGKDASALRTTADNLANWLEGASQDEHSLSDAAYTLQVGRRHFPSRRFVVAADGNEAVRALRTSADDADADRTLANVGRTPGVVFMFSGQGSQYVHMGREAYLSEPVFRGELDRCLNHLEELDPIKWRTLLYPEAPDCAPDGVMDTRVAQPLIFSISYALARLWMSWGVAPAGLIGHSIGEFVAATIAGSLSLEAALDLVATRGRLMQEMPPGAMLAVRAPASEIESLLTPGLAIAAVNGLRNCVVSGTFTAIGELEGVLAKQRVIAKRLRTSHAFHSPMMAPAAERFVDAVRNHTFGPAALPVASTLSGQFLAPSEWSQAEYWSAQIRSPVQFFSAVRTMHDGGNRVFLEVGPGANLASATRLSLGDWAYLATASLPSDNQTSATRALLRAAGEMWVAGVSLDWERFRGAAEPKRISLPTYPFRRTRHWLQNPIIPESDPHQASRHPTLENAEGGTVEELVLGQLQMMSEQLSRLASVHSGRSNAESDLPRDSFRFENQSIHSVNTP